MTPEEFAQQLGELKGLMTAVRDNQREHMERSEAMHQQQAAHIEQVRSQLSSKIDGVEQRAVKAIDEVKSRVDGHEKRLDAAEADAAKRGVQAGVAAGGISAIAVALAIKAGEMLLKLKGGQ
jgi:hypothetical protein